MVKIVEPSVELVWATPDLEQMIAKIARTCYKSEGTEEGNIKLLKRLKDSGHLAMMDHASISIKVITDRGMTHEIVRHRIGVGYAQESTRYCNYSKEKFGKEISVIKPSGIKIKGDFHVEPEDCIIYDTWLKACENSQAAYFNLINEGVQPQTARAVLPTCLKTEIVITGSITYWLHFIELRRSSKAHPDMQILAGRIYNILAYLAPNIFTE